MTGVDRITGRNRRVRMMWEEAVLPDTSWPADGRGRPSFVRRNHPCGNCSCGNNSCGDSRYRMSRRPRRTGPQRSATKPSSRTEDRSTSRCHEASLNLSSPQAASKRESRSSEGAQECSPQPALSEAEGAQAVGEASNNGTKPRRGRQKTELPDAAGCGSGVHGSFAAVGLCAHRAKTNPRSG